MWWPMMPDCECVTTMAPPSRSTSDARFCGVQVLAGESSLRIAGRAGRAGQRHLGVRHQLLVVLVDGVEREERRHVRVGVRASASDPRRAPCGISRPVRTFEPAGTRWPNHAVQAPLSVMRPKLGISSAAAFASPAASLRLGLVQHRLVEARAAAARLIDHVAGDAVADEVGIPAFAAVGRGLEARAGVRGAVHHDHRPAAAVFLGRDLELHVHLADGDLLRHRPDGARARRGRRRQRRRVLGDLLDAADEEAALVFDDQRAAEEFFRRRALPRHRRRQDSQQDDEGRKGSHEGLRERRDTDGRASAASWRGRSNRKGPTDYKNGSVGSLILGRGCRTRRRVRAKGHGGSD